MAKATIDVPLYAIVDAVATLTRSRIHKDGPFYLPRPRGELSVRIVPGDENRVTAVVVCHTWGSTTLTMELTRTSVDSDWLVWGDFSIRYGTAHHPGLSGRTISKRIAPSFATSINGLPMRYRVRTRVIR